MIKKSSLPGGRQRNAAARTQQSTPLLSHQLLSFTIFCTILDSSIIGVSSPPALFLPSSPFIPSLLSGPALLFTTSSLIILSSPPSLHSSGTSCMSAPSAPSSQSPAGLCHVLHPEWKVHRSKLGLRKCCLARSIVREAQPPSSGFKGPRGSSFLLPPPPPPHPPLVS